MIGFFDVNTIWRRKFGEALKRRVGHVALVAPFAGPAPVDVADPDITPVRTIRGWAGALAWLAMPWLLRRAKAFGRRQNETLATVVVTTPHYRALVRHAARYADIVYYCSDDYRSYAGWDPVRMTKAEAAICQSARLSIFVSDALRQRAITEYKLDPAKTWVSPNATEPRFAQALAKPAAIASLAEPVFGVAGMFNRRIDFAFLEAIAADARVGSLLLVGPIDEAELADDPALERLRAVAKVHFIGMQPHSDIPQWMAAFDVAVIPYAATPFNRYCSPMRLYDHLAIGQPIVATPHCDQIAKRSDIPTGDVKAVPELIGKALVALSGGRISRPETWDDRIDALQKSAVASFLFPA